MSDNKNPFNSFIEGSQNAINKAKRLADFKAPEQMKHFDELDFSDVEKFGAMFNRQHGFYPSNRFKVNILGRLGQKNGKAAPSKAQELIPYACFQASIPAIGITTDDRYFPLGYGLNVKRPWNMVYTEMSLVFHMDAKGTIHKFFSDWMNDIVPFRAYPDGKSRPKRAMTVNYPSTYMKSIKLEVLDHHKNSTIQTCMFEKAYPLFMEEVKLNWGAKGTIPALAIKLTYDTFDMVYHNYARDSQA